jgi:hypothetical protein
VTSIFVPVPDPWYGPPSSVSQPPEHELGTYVPLDATLVRTPGVAAVVRHLLAFSTGVSFTVVWRWRNGYPDPHWEKGGRWEATPRLMNLPGEVFRIGVCFQDGRSATSLELLGSQRPNGPTFAPLGGHGGYGWWHQRYWIGGFPGIGPITLVWEWPIAGVSETRRDLPTDQLRIAAQQARSIEL